MPTLPSPVVSVVNKAMQLDSQLRYQTPKELLVDLEKTIARLGDFAVDEQQADDDTVIEDEASRKSRQPQRAVMFVESDPKMQDIFRTHLKPAGFRVLISSDPARAIGRFE